MTSVPPEAHGAGAAPPPARTNPLAIASLVLGIASLFGCLVVTALPAVICGHLALGRIKRAPRPEGGRGLALAGTITGYAGFALNVLLVLALLPAVSAVRESAFHIKSASNLRQLGVAFSFYVETQKALPQELGDLYPYLDPTLPPGMLLPQAVSPASKDRTQVGYEYLLKPVPQPDGTLAMPRVDDPSLLDAPVIREIEPIGNRPRQVLYYDGSVGDER